MSSIPSTAQDQSYISTPHGEANIVPLDYFLHNILPSLRDSLVVTQAVQRLLRRTKGSSNPITLRGRWRGFHQDPVHSCRDAKQAFGPLKDIVGSILKVSGLKSLPFAFCQNPASPVLDRAENALPDAFFSYGPVADWTDLVAFGEYQKGDTREDVLEVCIAPPLSSSYTQPISRIQCI